MNNRGFILTLDAVFAAFIVLTILGYANYLVNRSDVTQWSEYRMLSTGYDIIAMLYSTGTLQAMNESSIQNAITQVLPANYEMRLEIKSYKNIGGTLVPTLSITAGPDVKDSAVRTRGRRTFLTFSNNNVDSYGVAEFWIWLK